MATIYSEIGGHEALTTVVDDFYRRVLADPQLAPFFTGTNLARLKGLQVEFFAAALGGPDEYSGQTMRDIHRGRGIDQVHFDLVAKYLAESLADAGVTEATANKIIATIAPLSSEIVSPAT